MLKAALLEITPLANAVKGRSLSGANVLLACASDRFDGEFASEFHGGGGSMLKAALPAIMPLANTAESRSLSIANALRTCASDRFASEFHDEFHSEFRGEVVPC